MTEQSFMALWVEESSEVADQYYPKFKWRKPSWHGRARRSRRGEYLRDQGDLFRRVKDRLISEGVIAAE